MYDEQVAKIGPGRQAGNGVSMAIQVQPGDGVKFREFAGSVVKIEGIGGEEGMHALLGWSSCTWVGSKKEHRLLMYVCMSM